MQQLEGLYKGQQIPLQRDIEAISIPFGKGVTIAEDSIVSVMQAKGSTISVAYEGRLFLVEGSDFDSLGLDPLPRPTPLIIFQFQIFTQAFYSHFKSPNFIH